MADTLKVFLPGSDKVPCGNGIFVTFTFQQVGDPHSGVGNLSAESDRTRRMRFFRAEWMLGWVVVSDGAAQWKGCVVEGQMGASGIAVVGGCVSAVPAQLGWTRRSKGSGVFDWHLLF